MRLWFVVAGLLPFTAAEIYSYNNFRVRSQWPVYHEIAQYAPDDAPADYAPGNGRSYIDVSALKLSVYCEQSPSRPTLCPNTTQFEISLFKKPTQDDKWLGYWDGHQYCCTESALNAGLCTDLGQLIIPKQIHERLSIVVDVTHEPARVDAEATKTVSKIKDSGLYILMLGLCDPEVDAVVLGGSVESMNPYGYLPGDVFGCLIFFGVIALVYLVMGVLWFIVSAIYSKDLMTIQIWISLVIFMGMLESAVLYFDYLTWNQSGTRDYGTMMFGVVIGVSKRALSRVLVLMTSMGYGLVLPTLGQNMKRILMLGAAYFAASLAYALLANVPSTARNLHDPAYMDLMALLLLIIAGIDTIIYILILQSLTAVIQGLESRKQDVKALVLKRLRRILCVSLAFAVVWAMYSAYISSGAQTGKHWRERWTVDALWEICYVLILGAIAFLWAPTRNAQRYAHSIQLSSVEGSNGVTVRTIGTDEDGDEVDEDDAEYGGPLPDVGEQALRIQTLDVHAAVNKMR